MFNLSYTVALRGPTSGLIRFCSACLFRATFLLVEFITPMFCDISPTCVCLLASSFLRFNRSNHSNQPGWAVFTLTPHPLTPAHTSLRPFYTPPRLLTPTFPAAHFPLHMCSPLQHTSSLLCTHTSSQSPHLRTFTPASTHYGLQDSSPHTPGSSPCPAASRPHSTPCT